MVACDYAAEEAVERIVAADAVVVGLNEPCTVVDIVGKEPFLFDADYVAVGLFNRRVNEVDEPLGLA